MRFESELASAPRKYPEYCRPNPCVPLWPLSDGGSFDAFLGDPSRTTVLNVAGDTVIIDVSVFAQPDKVEELIPRAQKVLDTVEWKVTS